MELSKSLSLLYDLDGTLVDSMPGIAMSFKFTLEKLGVLAPSDEQIRLAIGPGLHRALKTLLVTEDADLIEQAVMIYRDHHDTIGYKATTFYPGILDLITELHKIGVPQYVASMKGDSVVKPILKYLGALHLFIDAIGSDPNGKTQSKAEMLRHLSKKYEFSLDNSILVGDTAHDANAAKAENVTFFGVVFGYGTREELQEVGWGRLFESVSELRTGLLDAAEGTISLDMSPKF